MDTICGMILSQCIGNSKLVMHKGHIIFLLIILFKNKIWWMDWSCSRLSNQQKNYMAFMHHQFRIHTTLLQIHTINFFHLKILRQYNLFTIHAGKDCAFEDVPNATKFYHGLSLTTSHKARGMGIGKELVMRTNAIGSCLNI